MVNGLQVVMIKVIVRVHEKLSGCGDVVYDKGYGVVNTVQTLTTNHA